MSNSLTVLPVNVNVAILESDEAVDNFKEIADLPGTAKLKSSDVL